MHEYSLKFFEIPRHDILLSKGICVVWWTLDMVSNENCINIYSRLLENLFYEILNHYSLLALNKIGLVHVILFTVQFLQCFFQYFANVSCARAKFKRCLSVVQLNIIRSIDFATSTLIYDLANKCVYNEAFSKYKVWEKKKLKHQH